MEASSYLSPMTKIGRRLLLGFTLAFATPVHGAELVGKPRVIDGDTIEIAGERPLCAQAGRV